MTKMPIKPNKITMSIRRRHTNVFGWKISWIMFTVLASCMPLLVKANDCGYNEGYTEANCTRRNLKIVPWSLHTNIVSLDLSGNMFPTVGNQSFIYYASLRHISLRNNSVREILPGAFHKLTYLSTLDLSNNKLTTVPTDSLKMVAHSLVSLNLAGNDMSTIPSRVFDNLQNLKELDLTGNSIHRVSPGAFIGLMSLEKFKIRHNALKSLPSDSFDDFSNAMTKVELYDNAWYCDCRMRWLWKWLNNTNPSVWRTPGYSIRCDGPSFIRDDDLSDVPLDHIACEVEMKTGGSSRHLDPGANTTLLCKYSSVPEADILEWLKNSKKIDVDGNPHKYSIGSWSIEDKYGLTHVNELKIMKFRERDIGKYDCVVTNVRGPATTEYKVTLTGVDFDTAMSNSNKPAAGKAATVVDTHSIIIAFAVISGIVIITIIVIIIFCSINRVQRKRKQKRDTIEENIKQHFMNSEAGSNGDPASPNGKAHKTKSGDGSLDNTLDDLSKSNITMDSTYKPHLDLDDVDHMYPFEQPGSPNGNTYVSFGSELTEPNEFVSHQPHYSQVQPPPHYESSHAGSATPLLDRHTPSLYESEEPMEDYAQYPVYDSVTQSLQHPNLPSSSYTGNGGCDSLPNRQNSVASYASSNHNGGIGDRSFQYAPSINGSMPRTPGSTRSGFTYGPRSVDGDASPLPVNHVYNTLHQCRPPPQQSPNYNNKYMDYRDMPYSAAGTPPPHHMTPISKKSMSVGNLGYSPVPTSSTGTGPRKPPRIYQSREYMELTPQDSNGDYNDITSSDAQNYSQSYGITPGTPV